MIKIFTFLSLKNKIQALVYQLQIIQILHYMDYQLVIHTNP